MSDSSCKPSCDQIINIIPDPFVVIGRDYKIVAANHAYRVRYQVDEETDVVGRYCYEVSHHSSVPCSRNGEHCPLEEVVDRKEATQVMHIHFDHDGREEQVHLHASPLMDENGEVRYIGETILKVGGSEHDDAILVGQSRALLRMTSLLQRVAPTQTTVLLTGESGSGKEQVAKYIHRYSTRSARPFVVVDCGALGESLIESELFGYEKGAFTGAAQRKKGLFEAANGGTLFIDEIGELPMPLQTKLLRVLETGQIRRLGGTEYIDVDVRVIAATNRNLQLMVAERQFRQDLYYRLSAFPVEVPPLRARRDDIPRLAEHFISEMEEGDRYLPLSPEVVELLMSYDYPGNVRELRNVIERAVILACDEAIRPVHIVFERVKEERAAANEGGRPPVNLLSRRNGRLTNDMVLQALREAGGHRARAAELLGVSERTLYRYIRRLRAEGDTEAAS